MKSIFEQFLETLYFSTGYEHWTTSG